MKKSTFTDEQIIDTLRQAEQGVTAAKLSRNPDIGEQICDRILLANSQRKPCD